MFKETSPICGKKLSDYVRTLPVTLSLIIRGEEMIPATGELRLEAGDQVVAIATPHNIKHLETHLRKKDFLNYEHKAGSKSCWLFINCNWLGNVNFCSCVMDYER